MKEISSYCGVCKKSFSHHSSLRKHAKKFHPGQLDEVAPNKFFDRREKCTECNRSFCRRSDLKKHLIRSHPSETHLFTKIQHECKICSKVFKHLKELRHHKKYEHGTRKYVKCSLCDYQNLLKTPVLDHFETEHNIEMDTEHFQFESSSDFFLWKDQLEKETNSSYVNAHGSYKTGDSTNTQYICHRSGDYRKTGKGLRKLKTQGSNKINGLCPAELRVKILKEGICIVKYVKTHVGHEQDMGHLTLTKYEKQELAYKLASKLPYETILHQYRDSVGVIKPERINLLKKKVLYNIKQCSNVSKAIMPTEQTDVDDIEKPITDYENEYVIDDCPENNEDVDLMDALLVTKVTNEKDHFEKEKEKLKNYMCGIIDSISTAEELDVMQKLIAQIDVALQESKDGNIQVLQQIPTQKIEILENNIICTQTFILEQ